MHLSTIMMQLSVHKRPHKSKDRALLNLDAAHGGKPSCTSCFSSPSSSGAFTGKTQVKSTPEASAISHWIDDSLHVLPQVHMT